MPFNLLKIVIVKKQDIHFLRSFKIDEKSLVTDIVANDYRTEDIFHKYGIEYCCGGKWPLGSVCMVKGLDIQDIREELEDAMRTIQIANTTDYEGWSVDFLADYIINIHHHYLKNVLPEIKDLLHQFVKEHEKKYPQLPDLEKYFLQLYKETFPHLQHEEEIIFPYIRQIAHAFQSRESYASLLIRTLRKPVQEIMAKEHERVSEIICKMRELTNNYTPPPVACISHKVVYHKLKELDNDLVQHIHLENDILFPRAIAMEKDLLQPENDY
jgi:regulator of cell morphogenesis and NO signaling